MPRFFVFALIAWLALVTPATAADDVVTLPVSGSDYQAVHDALIEAIEAEGLVVGAVLPFNQMLQRTQGERLSAPYRDAEVVQFCSSGLAWQMIEEDASQIALCPLTMVLYVRTTEPEKVMLAWRTPGNASAGRVKAAKLLQRLAERTAELARLRW